MKRYTIGIDQPFEGRFYSFIYDNKFKSFVDVRRFVRWERKRGAIFEEVKLASPNFYVYFPGFGKNLEQSDKLP